MIRTDTANSGPLARRALDYLNDAKLRMSLSQLNMTAMQTLLGAVQRAGSLEEIEIIVRYQQAREKEKKWSSDLVDRLIKDMQTAAASQKEDRDRVRAAAQQLGLIARVHRVVEDRGDKGDRGERNDRADRGGRR